MLIAGALLVPGAAHGQFEHGPRMSAPAPPITHRGGPSGRASAQPTAPQPPGQPPGSATGSLSPTPPPSALDSADLFRAWPRTYAPRFDRQAGRRFNGGYGNGYPYLLDPFGYISQPYARPADDTSTRAAENGYLRIELEPDAAQVFVDGYYAGTVGDFRRGGGRALDAGLHRLEIRADGFEPANVEIRVRPNETLAYRGSLRRERRADIRAAVAAPKVFYVIPGCYAGDVRPRAEQLPAGCQIARLREVPPVVAPPSRQ